MSPALDALDRGWFWDDTSRNKVNDPVKFKFDQMISAPCRLGILATLVPGLPVTFMEMKEATSLSDGNLHVQTRKLNDVGYIDISKSNKGRRTVTEFRLTDLGRDRLRLHVMKLQQILDGESRSDTSAPPAGRADDSAVWA